MITLTHKLPDFYRFYMACSGGVDSMAALHWLVRGGRMPYGIIYVHHNTGNYADEAMKLVSSEALKYGVNIFIHKITDTPPKGASKEAWWREQRYLAFDKLVLDDNTYNDGLRSDCPIVLGHQLDDCVEQYIMSTMIRIKKNPIINYHGPANTIRPFRTWKKSDILEYAKRNSVKWVEDPSNTNTLFTRNKVRHDLMPIITGMNPGIYKHVKRLILNENLLLKQRKV